MVAVLFARKDSIYKNISGCDVFDSVRDALTWGGGCSVVAHPPCRLWSRMRHFSTAPESEKDLAIWSIQQVRKWGGVLEHPAYSTLWKSENLPQVGKKDSFGGWTLSLPQFWFGHRANKPTWLYIVGCSPKDLPAIPFKLGEAAFVVGSVKKGKPKISKAEREHTPIAFAKWLCCVAEKCNRTFQEKN